MTSPSADATPQICPWGFLLALLYEAASGTPAATKHTNPKGTKIMSGELVNWLTYTPAERQRDRAVARAEHNTDVALARVTGVAQVAHTAMLGTLGIAMMQKEAAFLAPQAADRFEIVSMTAAIGMATVINRLANQ